MKKFYEEHRRAVKVTITVLVLAIVAIGIFAFFRYDEQRNIRLAVQWRTECIDAIFLDGREYEIKSTAVRTNDDRYLVFEAGNDQDYIVLDGVYEGWNPETERIIYTDGKRVMSCDINGKDKETVYRFSGRADNVLVRGMLGNYAIAEKRIDNVGGGISGDDDLVIIDLVTGESTDTGIYAGYLPYYLTIDGDWLYYSYGTFMSGTGYDEFYTICRYNISTGEIQTITTDNIETADCGGVQDAYLYFMCSLEEDVFKIPVDGGTITTVELPLEEHGIETVHQILNYEGDVYISGMDRTGGNSVYKILRMDDGEVLTQVYSAEIPDDWGSPDIIKMESGNVALVYRNRESRGEVIYGQLEQ